MSREIILTYADEGVSARAVLLEKEAPLTCKAIWDLLPLDEKAFHAAYSGTIGAILIDPTVIVPAENMTTVTQPGDIMFTHYDANWRHGHQHPLSEIYWTYDRYARPTIPGLFVP